MTPAGNFSYQVVAIDVHGSTPSEWRAFQIFHNSKLFSVTKILKVLGLDCAGECGKGGVPLCYYGTFNRVEQYVDNDGAHCLCFSGFMGVTCDTVGE